MTTVHVRYMVDDVEAAVALYRDELGFEPKTSVLIVTGPGGSQILVEDPSGNLVELFQPRG